MSENFYQAPQSEEGIAQQFAIAGDFIQLQPPAHLPSACVKCGNQEALEGENTTLVYINPWHFLWILISPLILIIMYFIFRKTIKVDFYRCGECADKNRFWRNMALGGLLATIAAIVGLVALENAFAPYFALAAGVLVIFSLVAQTRRFHGLKVKTYQKPTFYLRPLPAPAMEAFRQLEKSA